MGAHARGRRDRSGAAAGAGRAGRGRRHARTRRPPRRSGCPSGALVVAGGMDQGAGAVGVGNVGSGRRLREQRRGADSAGVRRHATAAILPARLPSTSTRRPTGISTARSVRPAAWRSPGSATSSERRRSPGPTSEGGSAYDLLTALAAPIAPGADGLTMLPHLMGAFSPEYEPGARGAFYGFTLHHGKGHFVRAVLEAVAFMLRRNLELLAGAGTPRRGRSARTAAAPAARSGTRSRPTPAGCPSSPCRARTRRSAATRCSPASPRVSTAISTKRSRRWCRSANATRPIATAHRAYDAAYARYIELFEALRPLYSGPGAT